MHEARLIFNRRRSTWELWFDELQVVSRRLKSEVRQWAGRHNYTITEEP